MTDMQTGSQATQHSQTENASTEQSSSPNDAATSRKERKTRRSTPADKFREVNDLLTGALTPDDARKKRATGSDEGDDTSDADADGTDTRRPTGDGNRPPAGGEGDDAGDPSLVAASSPPKSLRDIAEQLGVNVTDIYDIDVPLKDGETVKLGALKDAFKTKQQADAEHALRASQLDERENAITQEQRTWAQLGGELAQSLKPETVQALKDRLTQQEQRERAALLQAMPELRDQTKFDAFRDEVVQTLGRYGYAPHEMVVSDHRQLLVVRDLARAHARLKQLRDYKPTPKPQNSVRPNGRGSPVKKSAQLINQARNSKHPSDKTSAVAALIKEG